jgi:flavin reductase (DIM6/NTAB) family NADH-FMN oxidoreductase RutF
MPVDQALFRQIAGSFASGVTVVTTGAEGDYQGMTASAFTSLSLTPPMILVCVDRTSRTGTLIQQSMESSGRFNVNILAADQEEVSRAFARSLAENESDSLRGVPYDLGQFGVPILKGTLAYFECHVALKYDGGDHLIFVGEVEDGGVSDRPGPLLYFRGKYRRLGEA